MELTNLKEKYNSLLKDQDFDRLDLGLKNPNIFQILQITKKEIRHSNFLSWLLDPNQSHRLGDVFLKRFLREVFSSDKFEEINQVDVEGLDLTKVQITRESNNIDILIELETIVIAIENKILSKEHSDQLTRYKDIVNRQYPEDTCKVFVYLTPDGTSPKNELDSWEPVSYDFIVESLDNIIAVYGDMLSQQVKTYIKDYITAIKRDIMEKDELIELSSKIYRNHKDLFEFVFKHKPDVRDKLREIVISELPNREWVLGAEGKYGVQFLTHNTKDLICIGNEKKYGWKKGVPLLFFEINLESLYKLTFKSVIPPWGNSDNSKRLEKMLLEINGFKEARGQMWLVNKIESEEFMFEDIPSMSDDEIKESVNSFYNKIAPIVKQVEEKLLEHKEELLSMQKKA